jgi:hypothetical protein
MLFTRWWLLLNQEESTIPTPTSSGKLRPFTVHPAHHRVVGRIGLVLCGLLLLATVILLVLGAARGNDYFVGAVVCGFFLLMLGWTINHRIADQLDVDESGVHITHGRELLGRRTQSVPWDQLQTVSAERVRAEGGFDIPFVRRLVVHTPTEGIPSTYGLDTVRSRLPQIVATIRSYRDQIRAGTATWVATDDEASAH